jgi:hypothetical protein
MKTNRIFIIAVIALVLAGATGSVSGRDVNSNAGTSAFPFLKINVSARAVGMGGAFTGLANDISSLYYNPAGLAQLDKNAFILGYHNYVADMQSGFAGVAKKASEKSTWGFYVSALSYGDFIRTDENGVIDGTFGGNDMLFAGSYAFRHGHNLMFGATAKFIYEDIDEFSATGIALDLGAKWLSDRERYSAGIMVQNLGKQLSSLGEEKDKLPLTFRAGGSATPRGVNVTFSSDVIFPIDNDPEFAIGGEYYEFKPLYLRLGYNSFGTNYRTAASDDNWAGLSFGAGFDFRSMQISYAFTPAAELGDSHRITLTGGF